LHAFTLVALSLSMTLGHGPGAASRPAVEDLSGLLAEMRKEHRVPGMVAAVFRSDGIIAIGATGRRRARSTTPVSIDDRFHLGSCTKSMTATLCAMLVEEGKLKWTTTVAEAFPKLKEKIHPGFQGVTLEQLLCHRSGLADDRSPDLRTWSKIILLNGDLREQRQSLVEIALGRAPAKPAGTAFAYSNYGFAIAGAMAEAATGEQYETLIRRKLFEPLGMTTAGFGAPAGDVEGDQPQGHNSMFGMYTSVAPGPMADNPAVITPAGRVHCSIGDWAKYAMLHLNAERGKPRLLKAETFKKLHDDAFDQDYAYGWAILDADWAKGKVLAHDGSNGLWYAVIVIAPAADIAFLVATNAGDETAEKACREARRMMRERFIPVTSKPVE
jgi:CubicO group peptidase (beta-lactamase class C family)